MFCDVLTFLSFYLVSLLVIYTSGFFILKSLRKTFAVPGFYTGFFLSFLFGLIVLICIFAALKANLLSVCVFFPVVFFLAFYQKKIKFTESEVQVNNSSKTLFYFANVLIILLPFIYFSLRVFKTGSFHFAALAHDNALYSELSVNLSEKGLENKWLMFFSDTSSIKGIEPYHYVDSWLNAIVYCCFRQNALQSYYLITYPLIIVISLSGILAIIEHFKKIGSTELILAVFLLFLGPVCSVKNLNYHFNSMACEIPLQQLGEKYAVYYPFVLLSILLLINNYFSEAILWILSLCVVSSTLVPAVFIFSLFVLCVSIKNWKYFLIRIGFFFIIYIGFFAFFSSGENSLSNGSNLIGFTDLANLEIDFRWFKLSLSNFVYGLVTNVKYFIVSYFYAVPLILYMLFFKRDALVNKLLFLSLVCFFGLCAVSIFYKLPDNKQLFTNTLPLFHCILIVFVIFIFYQTPKSKFSLAITSMLMMLLVANTLYCSIQEYDELNNNARVSDSYILKAKALILKGNEQKKIGFIYNQTDYNQLIFYPYSNYLYHLSYLGLNSIPMRLSTLDVSDSLLPLDSRKAYAMVNQHELFYRFCLNKHYNSHNSDSLKLSFIKNYQLNYILIGPTTDIPSYLATLKLKIITDSKTHIRFIRL